MGPVLDLVLADARIHVTSRETIEGWIGVTGDKVHSLGSGGVPPSRNLIDCRGAWVLPGLVDMHVHFRDPGDVQKEDFLTGSLSAAFGGVTTVIDMPNTGGNVVTAGDLSEKINHLQGRSHVDYALWALLCDSAPYAEQLAQMGVVGFKWMLGYGPSEQPSSVSALRDALVRAAAVDLLVGVHAESYEWITALQQELVDSGRTDLSAHGASRPAFVESLAVNEACILAAQFGFRLHIHHLSSRLGLDALHPWKTGHSQMTAEACPHHMFLTEEGSAGLGSFGRVNPPLRNEGDREEIWRAVVDGRIDVAASDHAPHRRSEKEVSNVWEARSGLPGVETLFPLLFDRVVDGSLSVQRFIQLTAEAPARIARLNDKGALLPGKDADIVLVDPESSTCVRGESLHGRQRWTPYEGRTVSGSIEGVFLRGHRIVDGPRASERRLGEYVRAGDRA